MKVLLTILVAAGSSVSIYQGLTFVATTTADASDSWNFMGAGLSDVHSFAVADTGTAGNTIAASRPASRTVAPSITSFSATPRSNFQIDSVNYQVQTAGQSYSLTNPDPQTLRFEVRPGDQAWYDSGHAVDRAEIENYTRIPAGTPINMNYQFMVESNGPNGSFVNTTDSFFILGQWHIVDPVDGPYTSPPFYVNFVGDKLQIIILYCMPGGNPANGSPDLHKLILWTNPNPIVPGHYYNITIQANFSNSSSGSLKVSLDGQQVVNYQGALGFGEPTYWCYGIYRSPASETVAANFRDMTITTGSGPPGVSSRRP
jgi:hypothetical protein